MTNAQARLISLSLLFVAAALMCQRGSSIEPIGLILLLLISVGFIFEYLCTFKIR